MPPTKGSIKAEDGRFYTKEEMDDLGLKPANKTEEKIIKTRKSRKKKAKPIATDDGEKSSMQIISAEEDKKISDKFSSKDYKNLPRITITTVEDGKMVSVTYVCDPESLNIMKNEDYRFTKSGNKKASLHINIETNVVGIE